MWKKLFGGVDSTPAEPEKIPAKDALEQVGEGVSLALNQIVKTDQDLWLYVMVQYERVQDYSDSSQRLMSMFPLNPARIEYLGRSSEQIGLNTPAIRYIDNQVHPTVSENFGEDLYELVVTNAFVKYCIKNIHTIQSVRLSIALDQYVSQAGRANLQDIDAWAEVIESLGGQVPGTLVGNTWNSRMPENVEELDVLCESVARQLIRQLPTEQDVYWFAVEEYDLILERGEILPTLYEHFPLFPMEHEGSRSEQSYVGKPNPGVVFLDDKVSPPLTDTYGVTTSNQIRAGVYTKFRELCAEDVDRLRVKYAAHYRDNCLKSSSPRNAARWNEVVEALTPQ